MWLFSLTYQLSQRTWFCRKKDINCSKFFLIFSFSTQNFRFLFSLEFYSWGEHTHTHCIHGSHTYAVGLSILPIETLLRRSGLTYLLNSVKNYTYSMQEHRNHLQHNNYLFQSSSITLFSCSKYLFCLVSSYSINC